jgi:hypothetical protein
VEVIRESHGAPLTPQASAALVVKSPEGARAAVAIRPVVRPDRRVELAVHKDAVGAPPPDPIHASGRALATANEPLIAHPSGGREIVSPVRVAPGAVVTAVARDREEKKREVVVAPPQPHPVAPQAIAASPALPRAAIAAPEPRPQVQNYSRPPRRVVEPGPDPIAHEAPPARVEVKQEARPEKKQEVKSEKKNEGKNEGKPEKGNEKEKEKKD